MNILNDISATTIEFGVDYNSKKYGTFKVLRVSDKIGPNYTKLYRIKFNYSGYEKDATMTEIKMGKVKDPYYPSICGVAYCGESDEASNPDGTSSKEYQLWHSMIQRCYDPKNRAYCYYGALGVRVCDRWLCFSNFVYDIKLLENYDKWKYSKFGEFQLEKDRYQQGVLIENKIYGPDVCWFSSREDNIRIRDSNLSNKTIYDGVISDNNGYYASINLFNRDINIGIFNNAAAAAQVRDSILLNLGQTNFTENNINGLSFNDVNNSYIGKDESIQKYFLRPMVTIINKDNKLREQEFLLSLEKYMD